MSNSYVIGYVGRIENTAKGVDFLPYVAQKLLQQGCDDFEVIIAGDGPDREETQQLCKELHVGHKFRFLGWQSDVAAFLSAVDVLVVPSRSEAFGLVALEALAMGVRVVAFDVGGIRDVLEGCEDARLVPASDLDAFANAILVFKQRYGSSRSWQSRSYVEQRFDRARMTRRIEATYSAVVNSRVPSD
ncbi:MAG: glycosyltransferase [Chloroflexi bacterium]|nr:glycosyltransferase [Chloroflexota bacterium]